MKLSNISNLLIRSFLIFIVAFLWVGYYIRGFIYCLLIAVVVAALVNWLVYLFTNRRERARFISNKKTRHMQQVILQLKFMTKAKALALFKSAFDKQFQCRQFQKKLNITIGEKTVDFFSLFHKIPSTADIIECITATVQKEVTICIAAEDFPTDVITFVTQLAVDVRLWNGAQVYNKILAPAETFPEITFGLKNKPALTFARLKNIIFSRQHTKSYLLTAVIIFLTGFVVRYSIYYIILASILLLLAASAYFFAPNDTKGLFD